MRTRVGVLIINNHQELLLIHRWKEGKEYFSIPGGGREVGEKNHQTAVREAKEETNLTVKVDIEPLIEFNLKDDGFGKPQHNVYYRCASYQGTPEFGLTGPEKDRQSSTNRYELEWVAVTKLEQLPIKPAEFKQYLFRLT